MSRPLYFTIQAKKPVVCSPNMGGPVNLLLDLGQPSGIIIPWEVRAPEFIPEIQIRATKVSRMHERGKDYRDHFSFPNAIVIHEKNEEDGSGREVLSGCSFRLLLAKVPRPGSYYMHFAVTYASQKLSGSYEFYQKITLVQRRLQKTLP